MNYCINRDDRPERWADVQKEFDRIGMPAKRVSAVISTPYKRGWEGCRDSHIKTLIDIDMSGEMGLVFEDDVVFLCEKEDFWDNFSKAVNELPHDWDALYLGASPQEPQERYSPHLYRLSRAWTTHAILWNHKGLTINTIITDSNNHKIGKWDVYLSDVIMPGYNIFVTSPMLCTQRQYQSDTCTRSDVSTILKNYQRFCV